MDLEVLIFELALILRFELFNIFDLLFLQPKFELLQISNLDLIVVNRVRHSIFLRLDKVQLHFDSFLSVILTIAHQLFIFENFLAVLVSCLLDFIITASDPVHCLLLTKLELLDLLEVHLLHFSPKRLHFIPISGSFLHPDP